MRFRLPLVLLFAGTLVWWGCEEQMAPETSEIDSPAFAKGDGGPPPDECDLKTLPLGDYFSKVEARDISALVKDLSAACIDGLQDEVLSLGFQILSAVDVALPGATDFGAGGQIVAGVWNAIQYNGGTYFACDDCAQASVDETDVAEAMEFGAFGVRSGGSEPVVSVGEFPNIWGIETEGGAAWSSVVPLDWVLIYGWDLGLGTGADIPLTTGFDWNVIVWWRNPTVATEPLLVGTCVSSTGANLPLVAHAASLLPRGDSPSYCQQELTRGDWVLQVASAVIPFWPQPLNASAMVGVSGSGKAREFSPFDQYDIAPYAAVTFTPLVPEDGFVDTELCQGAPCTTVTWKTEGGSTVASHETLRFTTEANSSAWATVKMCVTAVGPDTVTCNYDTTTGDLYAAPLDVTCDGRESAVTPCTGLAVTYFKSDKTGSHRICLTNVGGGEASGLVFDACTPTFNVRP